MSDTTRSVALVCRGDDPELPARLRSAAWRGLVPTVVAAPDDPRAERLARAAGAELGSIWPDTRRRVVWCTEASPRLRGHRVVVPLPLPGPDATHAVVDFDTTGDPVGGGRLALAGWTGDGLDALMARGWRIGPVGSRPVTPAHRLDGLRAVHVTSVHRPDDGRIFEKEVQSLRAAGADATVLALDVRPPRAKRLIAGWRLMARARRRRPDVVHVHDPELLPAAAAMATLTRARVIYDAHEYLGQTTRTKPWIPQPLRRPVAEVVERAERLLARRLDAVVTVTEDMAVDFAARGIDAVSVANFAPRARFPEPGAPEPGTVVYVGALDRSRGLELMLDAFPRIRTPGARLLLAGPGDPGPLPDAVEHLGRVAYDAVPAILARAAVIWMPLRRTPNNDRGRLTKVMEAMACGRPLVVSNLVRTEAIVRQAGCGLVVPWNDPAAHAAAIDELLADPDRAARMGAAGRRAFLDSMTFEDEAAKLVDLYARLTGRAG